jgi:hypothetical protein
MMPTSGPSYTPRPYGQSYNDAGLVYGLGTPSKPSYWVAPKFNPFGDEMPGRKVGTFNSGLNATELGRAANWITGTLASEAEKKRYEEYVKRFFPQGATFDQYAGLFSSAAQFAAQVNRDDPNARWSPWDALDKMWSMYSKNGGGAGGGATSYVNRSTQVNLTGKDESDATLDQALSTLLGRTATDAEKKTFLSSLNAAERANPSTSVTRGTQSSSGSTSSTTSQSTSVSAAARAQKFAIEDEGFAEYQYATTYLDAMLEALNSPVRM